MNDRPFDETVRAADEMIKAGHTVHQKFSCAECGARLGMSEPNVFHTTGACDQCGHVTDIAAQGCGFMLVMSLRR